MQIGQAPAQPEPEAAPGIPIGAMAEAMRAQAGNGPIRSDLEGVGQLSMMAMDQFKKNNPTLFETNGAFNWGRAMAPNQGWQTTVS